MTEITDTALLGREKHMVLLSPDSALGARAYAEAERRVCVGSSKSGTGEYGLAMKRLVHFGSSPEGWRDCGSSGERKRIFSEAGLLGTHTTDSACHCHFLCL